jgi:AraC-like DNA-binding protein
MYEAYFATLLEELTSRGHPAADLHRLTTAPPTAVALEQALVRALQQTQDPGLAIDYGLRLNLASHGILGYALMSSRNGDQLLTLLTRYAVLAMPSLQLQRVLAQEQLRLVCETQGGKLPQQFAKELVLTTLIAGARSLFNRRIPGAEIWLDFPQPDHTERYAALKIPVRFGQPYSALVCQRSFLGMEIASANPVMAELGARQCSDLLAQMQERFGITAQVRRSLLRSPGQFPSQLAMAQRLSISDRSLRRKLLDEGSSYREILDEVRFELAKRYLQTSQLSVTQVSDLLAYEAPSNFRRAFKRWSGVTAQHWRAQSLS